LKEYNLVWKVSTVCELPQSFLSVGSLKLAFLL
jgi:hypothetical protein